MKKQERHQAPDLRPRIEHQVGAQDPGDGAGRADERRGRGRVGRREPVRRDVTAGQVEDEKRDLAHAVFDVVAEHVHRGLPQAGDRRDQRASGGGRRHDDAANGHPHRGRHRAVRFRFRPPRPGARGRLDLVPAPRGRHLPGDGVGGHWPGCSLPRRHWSAAESPACARPRTCCRRRPRSPGRSATTPPRLRWRRPGSCCGRGDPAGLAGRICGSAGSATTSSGRMQMNQFRCRRFTNAGFRAALLTLDRSGSAGAAVSLGCL